jgi:hypothetical protein
MLDALIAELKLRKIPIFSYEHDGITADGRATFVTAWAKARGIQSKCKPMPQTAAELATWLAKVGFEEEPPPMEVATMLAMINDPLVLALRSIEKPPHDHESFARVLINAIGDGVNSEFVLERVDKEEVIIQWFNKATCCWITAGGARHLKDRCTNILRQIAPDATLTGLFGNADFLRGVVELVKGKLESADRLPMLDGDNSQFLLRFMDGKLMDFRTGLLRPCVSADRISLGTDCLYEEWVSKHRNVVGTLLGDLNQFWLDGGQSVYGTPFEPRLDLIAANKPDIYWCIYHLFENHDTAL